MSTRHTISLDEEVYIRLKSKGKFGESFNSLVNRLIHTIEDSGKESSGEI
jgi:predicted CopG family antitoxin